MAQSWLQYRRFRELADAQLAGGVSKEDQARGIGIELSTFVTFYSGGGKREPGKDTLKKLSAYYQVQLSELTDDPGAPVAGVPQAQFAESSEEERVMMRAMGSDLSKLTPEQRRAAFEAWSAIVRGYQAGKR
jgi:hypothetical protein